MSDPTDVIERAQAWLSAADERGINRTDRNGYLAVIEDLIAEVEFQRTALQGYRNRQIELSDLLIDIRAHGRITGDTATRLIKTLGDSRLCTCHPDDNPPSPCPKKYALSECRKAALAKEKDAPVPDFVKLATELAENELKLAHRILRNKP